MASALSRQVIALCQSVYQTTDPIELYRPSFDSSEALALQSVLDSGWVAMGGDQVTEFERRIADRVHRAYGLATIHATAALELGLRGLGVGAGDLVITQSDTFIAPINAITYLGAQPYFVDVEIDTLGMSPTALACFFDEACERRGGGLVYRDTGQRIAACMPVHALGLPARMSQIVAVCDQYRIPVLEDAAEALGSGWMVDGDFQPCGHFGQASVVSFNANKIITTGSGGMLLSDEDEFIESLRHQAKIAKISHPYKTEFDAVGHNYAMPNLNAAIGLAQAEKFDQIMTSKRVLAERYREMIHPLDGVSLIEAPMGSHYNHWICALLFDEPTDAQAFIDETRAQGVLTRPIWQPVHQSKPYQSAPRGALLNTEWLANRVVQLPSAPVLDDGSAVKNQSQTAPNTATDPATE